MSQNAATFAAALALMASVPACVFATPAAPGDVVGVGGFSHIVENVERSVAFYRDVLGFQTQALTAWDGTKLMMDTAGTPGAQFRRSSAIIPGTSVMMAFMEFKDIDRTPLITRIQDPGTAILQVGVRDIDATVKALKAAGVTVISKNGEPGSMARPVFVWCAIRIIYSWSFSNAARERSRICRRCRT